MADDPMLPEDEPDEGPHRPGEEDEDLPPPATPAGRRERDAESGDRAAESGEDADEAREEGDAGEDSDRVDDAPDPDASGSDDTVEADTVALADREEAEEAALAGLRARAAEASGPGAGGGATTGAPADGEGDEAVAEEEDGGADDAAEESAEEAEPEAIPALAAAPGDEEAEPPKRRGPWARFLAATVLIVASIATATSVSLLLVLTDLAEGIGGIEQIEGELEPVEGGDPQTILILGSDQRLGWQAAQGARSDTTIVLRVDPDREAIALLSIPRDLKINPARMGIDGLGREAKFNAVYSEGGPQDTLKAVKELTGLEINHVVNINFTGFAEAVNAIECVYIDVDRRYYVPEGAGYAAIDPPIEAGYQRLCGLKALQYVRFRHDDNDLVRAARQQDFLREARAQVTTTRLINDRERLFEIFKKYTDSDQALAHPIQLLELLKTFNSARDANVNEVHFPADLGDGESGYVTASPADIDKAVAELMGTGGTPGPKPGSGASERGSGGDRGDAGSEGGGGDRGSRRQRRQQPAQQRPDPQPGEAQMTDIFHLYGEDWIREHVAERRTEGGRRIVDFPVMYPEQVPSTTVYEPAILWSRPFPIDGPGNDVYQGYKIALGTQGSTGVPVEYWGVSGTNWPDPPILENPSETRTIGGREYLLFFDGDRLRLVGWKQDGRSYWVNNTLLQTLEEDEMLATARAMRPIGG